MTTAPSAPPAFPLGWAIWLATGAVLLAGFGYQLWRQETRASALFAADEARALGNTAQSLQLLERWNTSDPAPTDPIRLRVALTRRVAAEQRLAKQDYAAARVELQEALKIAVPGCHERPALEQTLRQVDRAEAGAAAARGDWPAAARLHFQAGEARAGYVALAKAANFDELRDTGRARKEFATAAVVLRENGRSADEASMWEDGESWAEAALSWTRAKDPARARAAWMKALDAVLAAKDFTALNTLIGSVLGEPLRQDLVGELRPRFSQPDEARPLAAFVAAAGFHAEAAADYERAGDWRAAAELWEKAQRPAEVLRLLRAAVETENDVQLTLRAAKACDAGDAEGRRKLFQLAARQAEAKRDPALIAEVFTAEGDKLAGARRLLKLAGELLATRPREAAEALNAAVALLPHVAMTGEVREVARRVQDLEREIGSALRLAPTVHARDASLMNHFDARKNFERSSGSMYLLNPASRRLKSVRVEIELTDEPPGIEPLAGGAYREEVVVTDIPASGDKNLEVQLKNPRPYTYWRTRIVEFIYER